MKSPHTQRPDADARLQTEEFIAEHARKAAATRAKENLDEVRSESEVAGS
jgi:hypothetical protein